MILVLSDLDAAQRAQLTSRSIPFVVMDPAGDPGDDVPSVGATNWQGGLAATRHLIELGHRRIGVDQRARPDDVQPRPGRRLPRGAGDRRPADRPRADQARATSTTRPATPAASNCCACPNRPTAIFAGNDLQALGVYEAARELGLRIPEDLSVVGFDDLPIARWSARR